MLFTKTIGASVTRQPITEFRECLAGRAAQPEKGSEIEGLGVE